TLTTSCKKRNASNKLDLPEALGPIKKARSCRATSTLTKLRQFPSRRRRNRPDLDPFRDIVRSSCDYGQHIGSRGETTDRILREPTGQPGRGTGAPRPAGFRRRGPPRGSVPPRP